MKSCSRVFVLGVLLAGTCIGAQEPAAPPATLESVLAQMDEAAERFRSAAADVVSEQYQKVVDETDTQTGRISFLRRGHEMQMLLQIRQPDLKEVLVKNGKAQLYQPRIDQVTEYALGQSREDSNSMVALGFGGRGHDLLKSFEVKLAGAEVLDGVQVFRLEITPKSDRVRNMFSHITLWVDAERDVTLRQVFTEPSGDYRRASYTNIQLNPHLSEDLFKLNTTGHTKVVRPQG